jgi:ERCC4 domain
VIYVDYREGSKHLLKPLTAAGVPVEKTDLPFGDVAFEGRGVNNESVMIGVELKKLNDLVASLRSGRLVDHQIPGMVGPEGIYKFAWVLVEGQYRTGKAGELIALTGRGWRQVPGQMSVSEMEKRLHTIALCTPMRVWTTNREEDTVSWLVSLYRWWTDKSLDQHATTQEVHQPNGIIPVSDFRATLMVRCPAMGRSSSLAAEKRFGGSLRKAALATAEDWANIETQDRKGGTKRVGLKRGAEIEAFWRG